MNKSAFTLMELTKGLDVTIKGDAACLIEGVAPIHQANAGDITFLNNSVINHSAYQKYLSTTKASAVILKEDAAANYVGNAVVCRNPYYIYAKIAANFARPIRESLLIHPSAVIGEDCQIDASVRIGANTVIGDRVRIEAGATIDANVTIYHDVSIGKRTRIASGAVIGSDGFGFANEKGAWHKVPQLGGVSIGDDVDIGANTAIDRGAIENTIIGHGVKLDNLIQVGHNVQIGDNTIIAGCVAIAGSTIIGKNCMIGGMSSFAGHISVCDNVMMTGMTTVTKSITEPGIYSAGIVGAVTNLEFRKNNARFNRLETLYERVRQLEKERDQK